MKKFVRFILIVLSLCFIFGLTVDFVRFPECYISTWRYQLENDIKAGDREKIDYYEKNYIANGRELF